MISPAPLPALLPRTDITRLHFTPGRPAPRHTSDGLNLLREAIAHVQVFLVRTERGVPTRVMRALRPEEVGTHQLVPDLTAYAWGFIQHADDQSARTYLLVVAQHEVREPYPDEDLEFWGQHGPVRNGREIPDRRPTTPVSAPAPAAPRPAKPKPSKPPKPRPDGRAGKKGPKNKGRKRR
ncbi:hypothetical protein M8445_16770 (plasmid) [Deinococcus aquaticus]|uniref:Uncharacterized protein n=1 Tax=Deinococcus aquaticus TaxID=328692 RepID=A0ABY7V600_9DEIO|nr:hypothetical protein [Deinococcus aquaticus]WDA60619.1 hypothetical protein M8445_16770 [Deinococcus aquaticus]